MTTDPTAPRAVDDLKGWSAVGRERRTCSPSAVAGLRAEVRPAPTRYRSAVPAPIAALTPRVDGSTAALAEEATQELSRLGSEHGSRVASPR